MTTLHIDFETRSTVDLKTAGAHAYADDPSTDVWCMAYVQGDAEIGLWSGGASILPPIVNGHVKRGGIVVAHNAAFELAIWNRLMVPRYGWPPLDPRQVRCTMAMAYAMSLPGSLENAAAAVGLDIGKDMQGRKLMMQMARPRSVMNDGTLVWWDDEARRERLYAYCRQDVEVERQLEKRLLALVPSEQELWTLDQTINDRGVRVDLATIDKMLRAVEMEKKRLDGRMAKATGGRVTSCNQVAELTSWIVEQGVVVDGLAKADVTALLDRADLPPAVREALRLRREGAKSSVAKLKAMRLGACADGRVRGLFQFHAASTGRWGGRRIQPQNFPRPELGHGAIEKVVGLFEGVR
jgi:DNA polymerase